MKISQRGVRKQIVPQGIYTTAREGGMKPALCPTVWLQDRSLILEPNIKTVTTLWNLLVDTCHKLHLAQKQQSGIKASWCLESSGSSL